MKIDFLTDHWRSIADECAKLPGGVLSVKPGQSREDIAALLIEQPRWVIGWDGYYGWWNWGLAINYQFPLGDAYVPKTIRLLKDVDGLKFASISLLKAGTLLRCHSHPENKDEKLFTYHLGLDVPDDCWLNTGTEFEREQDGRTIVFDGSKPHYAFNASDKDRLILHCEFRIDK